MASTHSVDSLSHQTIFHGIDKSLLDEEDIIDLEADVCNHLKKVVSEVESAFIPHQTPINPEHMFAQMGLYLGVMAVIFLDEDNPEKVKHALSELIYSTADYAKKGCEAYGLHHNDKKTEAGGVHALRKREGNALIAQTVRGYRYTLDTCQQIAIKAHRFQEGDDLSKLDTMIPIYLKLTDELLHMSCSLNTNEIKRYLVKYTAIQIGWFIGFYADLEKNITKQVAEFSVGSANAMIDFGGKIFIYDKRKGSPMDLITKTQKIGERVRNKKPLPKNTSEEKINTVLESIKSLTTHLLMDNVDMQILHLITFQKWLFMMSFNKSLSEEVLLQWDKFIGPCMRVVGDSIKKTLGTLQDKGSNKDLKALATQIEKLKQAIYSKGLRTLTKEEADAQWGIADKAIDSLLDELIHHKMPLDVIESTFLYMWSRFYAIGTNLLESEYQKMERHWPSVYREAKRAVLQFLDH